MFCKYITTRKQQFFILCFPSSSLSKTERCEGEVSISTRISINLCRVHFLPPIVSLSALASLGRTFVYTRISFLYFIILKEQKKEAPRKPSKDTPNKLKGLQYAVKEAEGSLPSRTLVLYFKKDAWSLEVLSAFIFYFSSAPRPGAWYFCRTL